MSRPALEVADIFRDHGAAWRKANAGHVSLGQMKVMSAIEHCRTAALGGHVARCENDKCAHMVIVYNSCRNRHCPKCQGAAAKAWLAEQGFDPAYGARPLRRLVQREIGDRLARALLAGEVRDGDTVVVDLGEARSRALDTFRRTVRGDDASPGQARAGRAA